MASNYRAACRGRSKADFIAKMGIVEEEADESLFWMEMLIEAEIVTAGRLLDLMKEGDEILSIVVATLKTSKSRK